MTDKTYTKQELEEMTNALLAEDNKKKKAEANDRALISGRGGDQRRTTRASEKGKLDDKTIAFCPPRR